METVYKMKKTGLILSAQLCFYLICSCISPPPPPTVVVVHDPLVLQEVAPLPRAVVAARQAITEYEPIYATLRIIEVSEVNGVQKYFLVRMGADKTGITVGVTGDIGEDTTFQRIIGNYKIIELSGDFFRCEITELSYRIGTNAHVRVQTGEKIKEAAAQ
jgi:hypothetical protein